MPDLKGIRDERDRHRHGRARLGLIAIAIFAGLLPPIIDRVVRATVSRRMGSVHPMVTLVGALVGVGIAGVTGLILGPVILAMFFVLLEVYDKEQVTGQPL